MCCAKRQLTTQKSHKYNEQMNEDYYRLNVNFEQCLKQLCPKLKL